VYERNQAEKKIDDEPYDARFLFAMFILDLQNAGFPIDTESISLEQWNWISQLKAAIQELQIQLAKKPG